MSAIGADIDGAATGILSGSVVLGRSGGRPFRPRVRPELPENRYSRHDSLLARCGTVWTMSRQLPAMVQVLEKSTTDPCPRQARASTG